MDGESGKGRGSRRERRARPLDEGSLQELAFHYVARFATSRAKLVTYLKRKVRERGWNGKAEPDPARLADKVVDLGFIDDAAFAGMKAASLTRRGYGRGRVRMVLTASGIGEEDGREALAAAEEGAVAAALRFAQRKRIGPFAAEKLDLPARQKALAAMLRAGHSMDLARRIVTAEPGSQADFSANA